MKRKYIAIYLFCTALVILTLSCSRHVQTISSTKDIVIYPPPPDTTRIQYLTSFSNSRFVIGNRSAFGRFILGELAVSIIQKPYGIFMRNGKIYICDTGLDALEILDLQNHKFEYFSPGGRGQLKKPVNCYVDDKGLLYVADVGRKQIVVFDSLGKYVTSLGEAENFRPTDVFVKGEKIWVANFANNQLNVYDRGSYELIYTMPNSELGNDDYLYSPSNIYVTDDKVYVSDFGDFKIKIYSHDGEFISSVGSFGRNIGQFVRPKGIAVDREDNLYVVDAGFENTQIFNREGQLLMFFGGPYSKPGDMWLPAKVYIDYDNLQFFEKYVDESFKLKYLIFVTNQYGPQRVNVYGYVDLK